MYKLLKDLPKVDVQVDKNSPLPVLRCGIFLYEPDESFKFLPPPPEDCPVCGKNEFAETEKLLAVLNPKLDSGENGLSYLMLVQVHPECFADCLETDEPEPTPW